MPGPPRGAQSSTACDRADRRAAMWRMRVNGHTQAQIAERYGITQQAVSKELRRAIDARPATSIDEYREIQLDKLDRAERAVLKVMETTHYLVSRGGVVTMRDQETGDERILLDDAPILQAVDRIIRLVALRSDLLGLKAPVRVNVDADLLGQEINELITALGVHSDADRDT